MSATGKKQNKNKNKKRAARLQDTPAKNPKTNQTLKFIQFVSIMMLKCGGKMKSKDNI